MRKCVPMRRLEILRGDKERINDFKILKYHRVPLLSIALIFLLTGLDYCNDVKHNNSIKLKDKKDK